MKKVTLRRYEDVILPAHPNAHIETRDGVEYVVIPTYDWETDESGENLLLLDRGEHEAKFQPGDVLRHTETGSEFTIVDPLAAMMRLRKGPIADG